jgi:hypothetical protein
MALCNKPAIINLNGMGDMGGDGSTQTRKVSLLIRNVRVFRWGRGHLPHIPHLPR